MIDASARPGVSRQRRSQPRYPERHRARAAVAQAIRSGRLERPDSCSRCKRPCKPDSHHADYSAPLKVEWLCHWCHMVADRETKNELAGATLARICEERGMRRKDMAEALSVSPSVLSEWIAGIKRPSGDNRALIEVLYGVESRRWTPADQLPQDGSATGEAA